MQNYKKYAIPPAQLIIADVPYNVGNNFYGSNPMWYNGGDNKNGESKLAGKSAFNSDFNFNLYEYFHFCHKMLKKDDKKPCNRGRSSDSPCMIVFCSFEQLPILIDAGKKHGFDKYIPLVFIKNYSPQVLKANMRVVGATEYALLLYRDRLPKFRNGLQVDENGKNIRGTGHMIFNWFEWERDGKDIPKIHPAQKSVKVLKKLIEDGKVTPDCVVIMNGEHKSSKRVFDKLNIPVIFNNCMEVDKALIVTDKETVRILKNMADFEKPTEDTPRKWLVVVKHFEDSSGREFTFESEKAVEKGDMVLVKTRYGESMAKVKNVYEVTGNSELILFIANAIGVKNITGKVIDVYVKKD